MKIISGPSTSQKRNRLNLHTTSEKAGVPKNCCRFKKPTFPCARGEAKTESNKKTADFISYKLVD